MPCCDREVYTIKVDSSNVSTINSNAASFVAYLPVPLTNVVKMELLSACITPTTNTSPIVYFHVEELISKFVDRAQVTYTIVSRGDVYSRIDFRNDIEPKQARRGARRRPGRHVPGGHLARHLYIRRVLPDRSQLYRTDPSARSSDGQCVHFDRCLRDHDRQRSDISDAALRVLKGQ